MPEVKWGTPVAVTAIDAVSVNAGANKISAEIAQSTKRYADIEVTATFAVAPVANTTISLFLLYKNQAGIWERGSDSVDPLRMPVGASLEAAAAEEQPAIFELVMIPPRPFKVLVLNDTAQTAVITVTVCRYNEVLE